MKTDSALGGVGVSVGKGVGDAEVVGCWVDEGDAVGVGVGV